MQSKHKDRKKTDVTINNLPMDTAIVEVTCEPTDKNYSLFGISDNCHKVLYL